MWGSASDPGLDGSKLATATNSIVAVIQYRLGVVSFWTYYFPHSLMKILSSASWHQTGALTSRSRT